MPLIFDNLTASVIAATVVLIFSSIQMRATQQRVAQMSQRIVQQRSRVATEWLEEDLERIGQNMTSSQDALEQPEPYHDPENNSDSEEWLTEKFVFRRNSVANGGDIQRIEVRYKVESQGTMSVEGKKIPIYRLVRKWRREDGESWSESDWVQNGRIESLEYFDVDLLDRNAQETTPSQVQSVRIRFSVVAPFQNEEMAFPASRTNVVVARFPLADS